MLSINLSLQNELIPINALTLAPNTAIGVDVYLNNGSKLKPVLFCANDVEISSTRLNLLATEGVTKLFIHRDSYDSYQSYLRENWETLIENENLPSISRVTIMIDVVRAVLSEELSNKNTSALVNTCDALGESIAKILGDQPILVTELCDVIHHDYATFTHSTNVASYAVVLARSLGFSQTDIKQIAVGALLHDLGKLEIPERILTKPGRLDEYEFREVKKHPTTGFKRLVQEQQRLNFSQLMMVYQHHEKLDGSGYPVGITGQEIHPWAKLCSVVDIFEALTSQRPYRKPMSHTTALAVLDKAAGSELDEEIVKCWRSLVQTTA